MNTDIPTTLGELFDRTINLIGRTAGRNAIIGSLLLLPLGGILGFAFRSLIGAALEFAEQHVFTKSGIEQFTSFLPHIAMISVAGILLFIVSILAQIAMMRIVVHELEGMKISWSKALSESVGERWLRGIAVSLLKSFLLTLVIVLPVLLVLLSENLLAVALFSLFFIGIPCSIYLAVCWGFTLPAIVRDDSAAISSMKRSWNIIHEQWWRTFGLFILFGFSVSAAISIVGWPLNFIVLGDFWVQYFQMIFKLAQGGVVEESVFYEMFLSLGIGYGLLLSINLILTSMLESVCYIILYESTKRRKNEIRSAKLGFTQE